MRNILVHLAATAAAMLAAACGGGAGPIMAGIGSGGTGGIASGPINGFGSVIVNGVRFDDTGARVTIDGVPDRPVSDLRLGMVVEVHGGIDAGGKTGRAEEIVASLAALGPVDATSAASGTLTVLGQRVRRDAATVFDGFTTLDALAPGDLVAVSGLHDADGAIVATRIERRPAASATAYQAEGMVSGLTSTTFRLESLTVDFSRAQLTGFPASGLANGQLVSVRSTALPAGGRLDAAGVRLAGVSAPAGTFVEYVGYVSGFRSLSSFGVGALRVDATSAQFVGGAPSGLADGVRVEVEGRIVDGTVVASEIDFLTLGDETAAELDGPVTDFLSVSSFRVRGQQVDASRAAFTGGTVASLANGRIVHVIGMVNGSVVAASSVDFRDAAPAEATRLAVDGTVTDFVSPASFRVNGRAVAANAATVFRGGTAADLANGCHVAAEGVVSSGVLNAASITLFPADAPRNVSTEGRIENFVSLASFTVNGQAVAAGGATVYTGGNASQLANGVSVEVTGTLSGGVLHASAIDIRLPAPQASGEPVEVEGYITQFASVSSFKVAGQLVDATAAVFENGSASSLANGLKVKATGPVSGGVLRATKIEISR
ncbi:MAG TPA: DUF5666 domain-containing protein [Usitatibacter sp.]|nr:DUF5666 domain-containing protein [Usitatibacter sp.]